MTKISKRLSRIFLKLALVSVCIFAYHDNAPALTTAVDKNTKDSASIFSPGYINATKQKTQTIIEQATPKKSLFGTMMEFVGDILFMGSSKEPSDDVVPYLKKKTSSLNTASQAITNTSDAAVEGSAHYDIQFGGGTNKTYDSGRLISEIISGKLHVYVGFEDVGMAVPEVSDPRTIQDAVDYASSKGGGIVIVKGGTSYDAGFIVKDGVSVYGGYNEDGTRDVVNNSTDYYGLIGAWDIANPIEISGFTFNSMDGIDIARTSNLTLSYNNFYGATPLDPSNTDRTFGFGIKTYDSSVTLSRNNFYTIWSIWVESNSTVRSINNNYFTDDNSLMSFGSTARGGADSSMITSANDYFVGGLPPDGMGITVANPVSQPNARYAEPGGVSLTNKGLSQNAITRQNYYRAGGHEFYENIMLDAKDGGEFDTKIAGSALKAMILGKAGGKSMSGKINIVESAVVTMLEEAVNISTLALPLGNMKDSRSNDTVIIQTLANLLNNPTDDQEKLLDILESLVAESEKAQAEASNPAAIKQAEDALLQVVAAALLAQAIPDLLKEGDISNIKLIFMELDKKKEAILTEYKESTRPYYDEIVKEISKNMAILKFKGMISNDMMEDDLRKILPSEIMKIIDKIRNSNDKSFEEEYMLQQEAKYRKKYLDSNRRLLEERMKGLLKDFTKRIFSTLEGSGLIKVNTKEKRMQL